MYNAGVYIYTGAVYTRTCITFIYLDV